jgi:hypothetical protein
MAVVGYGPPNTRLQATRPSRSLRSRLAERLNRHVVRPRFRRQRRAVELKGLDAIFNDPFDSLLFGAQVAPALPGQMGFGDQRRIGRAKRHSQRSIAPAKKILTRWVQRSSQGQPAGRAGAML